MLRHNLLFDPVKRPEITKDREFDRYVEIHKNQTGPTSADAVESIKRQFYEAGAHASVENLDKIWGFVSPKVEENNGLAEFIRDYRGAESQYFFPWLINVFRSPATALEISYGAGPDLNGEWDEGILDTDDPIVPFVYDDPAFVYNRERQLYIADLAISVMEERAERDRSIRPKIVDYGAGRMAWMRRHGLLEMCYHYMYLGTSDIYAFDKDQTIKPEDLFIPRSLQDLGIKYKYGDFTSQLTNPDCRDADLIILGGVACYIPSDVFYGKIVPAIYGLLNEDGIFFFDLQTSTPCYRHSMDILDWQNINLPEDPVVVIDSVEKARKHLWDHGIKFSAEYKIDTFNKIPSAVMITMQKL